MELYYWAQTDRLAERSLSRQAFSSRIDRGSLLLGCGPALAILSAKNFEMRLGRDHRYAIDWDYVLWARREYDDAIHLGL